MSMKKIILFAALVLGVFVMNAQENFCINSFDIELDPLYGSAYDGSKYSLDVFEFEKEYDLAVISIVITKITPIKQMNNNFDVITTDYKKEKITFKNYFESFGPGIYSCKNGSFEEVANLYISKDNDNVYIHFSLPTVQGTFAKYNIKHFLLITTLSEFNEHKCKQTIIEDNKEPEMSDFSEYENLEFEDVDLNLNFNLLSK